MGIPGLTLYFERRSRDYYQIYQLHDCDLVIDGSSLCHSLHNWNYSYWKTGYSYDCYGGDYDRFAQIVKYFFEMLQICNVTPYIVFGGCNGQDRLPKIITRLQDKAKASSETSPDVIRNNLQIEGGRRAPFQVPTGGAVCLRNAFRDILSELKLKTFTCEGDPNREIASFAKHLNCPVLSANSDFFILGSSFIPFPSLHCEIQESNRRDPRTNSYKFIKCKLYRIENLLNSLNKKPYQTAISYLLPVLLGSDQVKQELLEPFLNKFKIDGGRQKKIAEILEWIRRQQSLEAASNEILNSFVDQKERHFVSQQINHAIEGFSPAPITPLLDYFNIEQGGLHRAVNDKQTCNRKTNDEKLDNSISELLMERIREGRYPAFFLDMLQKGRYMLLPNIEDCSQPDANTIGYPIIAAIHNILVQNDERKLTVFRRNENIEVEEFILPSSADSLPSVEEIDYMLLEAKQQIMLKILEIDNSICEIFETVSKDWQLFIISLKYASSQADFEDSFIYACILCFIILNYVDPNLKEFYRLPDEQITVRKGIKNADCKVSADDCLNFMQKCIKYFEMDSDDTAETYDRGIMHCIAQFQCVFLHVKFLNNLFDYPFQDCYVYKMFNNTFIYNMTTFLREHGNLKDYVESFLSDCQSVHSELLNVVEMLEKHNIL